MAMIDDRILLLQDKLLETQGFIEVDTRAQVEELNIVQDLEHAGIEPSGLNQLLYAAFAEPGAKSPISRPMRDEYLTLPAASAALDEGNVDKMLVVFETLTHWADEHVELSPLELVLAFLDKAVPVADIHPSDRVRQAAAFCCNALIGTLIWNANTRP